MDSLYCAGEGGGIGGLAIEQNGSAVGGNGTGAGKGCCFADDSGSAIGGEDCSVVDGIASEGVTKKEGCAVDGLRHAGSGEVGLDGKRCAGGFGGKETLEKSFEGKAEERGESAAAGCGADGNAGSVDAGNQQRGEAKGLDPRRQKGWFRYR